MTYASDNVLAAARAVVPESEMPEILAALALYGTEPYEHEIERVRLAILELSGGSKEKLLQLVKAAKLDYRDVLAWQQLGPVSPEEGGELKAAARSLIESWGKK
jgi:hypothetical protein